MSPTIQCDWALQFVWWQQCLDQLCQSPVANESIHWWRKSTGAQICQVCGTFATPHGSHAQTLQQFRIATNQPKLPKPVSHYHKRDSFHSTIQWQIHTFLRMHRPRIPKIETENRNSIWNDSTKAYSHNRFHFGNSLQFPYDAIHEVADWKCFDQAKYVADASSNDETRNSTEPEIRTISQKFLPD